MATLFRWVSTLPLTLFIACGNNVPSPTETGAPELPDEPRPPPNNVLLVLLDDVGVDKLALYGALDDPPLTPVLDGLAAQGVLFQRAYATPICSPTRAALLTGRHPRRTGIGALVRFNDTVDLSDDEVAVPAMLHHSPRAYTSALSGKWHLSALTDASRPAATHPARMGFDWHAGSVNNLRSGTSPLPSGAGYYLWEKNDNGVLGLTDRYATTDSVDDAIAQIGVMAEPWFTLLSLNAAHEPLHVPPPGLTYRPYATDAPDPQLQDALIESIDIELGRLLASIDPDVLAHTTVIIVGDNGTPVQMLPPTSNPRRAKGSPYEAGVRVPLIIAGPMVTQPNTTSAALVQIVDLFPTIAEIAEVPLTGQGAPPLNGPIDGISLLPWLSTPDAPSVRQHIYLERFAPNGRLPERESARAIHDGTWKYLRIEEPGEEPNEVNVTEELYFLVGPLVLDEGPNLLAQGEHAVPPVVLGHLERLRAALADQVANLTADR